MRSCVCVYTVLYYAGMSGPHVDNWIILGSGSTVYTPSDVCTTTTMYESIYTLIDRKQIFYSNVWTENVARKKKYFL